jgi:uncharacterized protein (TIGR02001 family)
MKTRRRIWAGAAGLVVLAGAVAGAAEAEVSADVVSQYVWRGQVLNEEASLQPSLTVGLPGGFSVNVWGSMNLTDEGSSAEDGLDTEFKFIELDLTLSYALPLGEDAPISAEVGVVQYTFPEGGGSTREAYLSIGANLPLSPTATVYYDFDAVEGWYGSFGLGHAFELGEAVSLELGASVGYADSEYNEVYFGTAEDALNDLTASATLTYTVSESLSVSGLVQYFTLLDSSIQDGAKELYGDDQGFVGGGRVTYSF